MKIKMKVKTLIILIIVFIVGFGFILPEIFLYGAGKIEDEKALSLYGYYINMPFAISKDKALYKMAKSLVPYIGTYDLFMGARGSRGGLVSQEDIDKALESYEEILDKYKNSPYYVRAYKELLDIYIGRGQVEKLKELIDWGRVSSNEGIVYTSQLYTAFNHMVNREYDEAMEIVEKYISEGVEDRRLYGLKGSIHFLQEEYPLAEKSFEDARTMPYIHDGGGNLFGSVGEVFDSYWLDSFLRRYKGDHTIRGRVTANGKPLPYAQIYIHSKSQYGSYSSRGEIYVALTDFNGEFETIGLKEGQYEIGVGVSQPLAYNLVFKERNEKVLEINGDVTYNFEFTEPMELISPRGDFVLKESKFNLKWEKVEGADYYKVFAVAFEEPLNISSSSISYTIPNEEGDYEIRDNETRIDIDLVNFYPAGVFFSGDRREKAYISPNGILGTFYPGVRVPIIVKAFDKEGNLLNSSLPLISNYEDISVVRVENRELTEGERLILNREYEEAIEYYEGLLKEDSTNIEALTYLSRIYADGWILGKDNLQKAKEYTERLYSITGDDKVFIRLDHALEREK
ncbi:MAG: hypothetical protein GXZ06_07605 [Tissierellia bacterium]|nr:hypothetical protein [Tissierellia bacterium]